jgi:hypothetical protein
MQKCKNARNARNAQVRSWLLQPAFLHSCIPAFLHSCISPFAACLCIPAFLHFAFLPSCISPSCISAFLHFAFRLDAEHPVNLLLT